MQHRLLGSDSTESYHSALHLLIIPVRAGKNEYLVDSSIELRVEYSSTSYVDVIAQ